MTSNCYSLLLYNTTINFLSNKNLIEMLARNVMCRALPKTGAGAAFLGSARAAGTASTSNQQPVRVEKSINSVQLLGRVGAEPQKKGTELHPMVSFSLATHTNYRYDSGEYLQRTEWHRVICFKPGLRETILNYLKKGQRVHVTGRITYGEVKGEDGSNKSTTAIVADDIIFFNSTP